MGEDVSLMMVFNKFDRNKDNTISVGDLSEALFTLGMTDRAEQEVVSRGLIKMLRDKSTSENVDFVAFSTFYQRFQRHFFPSSVVGPDGNDFVFLGGSCNPTTWRRDVTIPALNQAQVEYYNPQVDFWSEELVQVEAEKKKAASVLLFVIDSQTRAIGSMVEIAEHISAGRRVVLVVNDVTVGTIIGDAKVSVEEAKDLNRARTYLKDLASRHKIRAHSCILEATLEVISIFRLRLKKREESLIPTYSSERSVGSSGSSGPLSSRSQG